MLHGSDRQYRGLCKRIEPSASSLKAYSMRSKSKKSDNNDIADILVPLQVKVSSNPDDINLGEDLSGSKLIRIEVIKTLNSFSARQPIRKLSADNGLESKLFYQAFISFRKLCVDSKILPPELHIMLNDINQGHGHVDDLFPFFLKHARMVFPHLECLPELKKISDSRLPHNWYPEARAIERKIIFHSGPTNSGKTYNAMKAFIEADSGVYCGPLKMLAVEVCQKTNEAGTPCDLVTGEERRYAISPDTPSSHTACTVEMVSVTESCDVAVIDEIQMVRDMHRGWAWTRALLGIPAKEIHVCGEEAALDVIKNILLECMEDVEIRRYDRLTKLTVEDSPVVNINNIQKGDCIVCFNKSDIYNIALQLEKMGHEVAVIYGSLPPSTKLAQAARFNDPNSKCKILVATDAIGMGLNLSIGRVIFFSLTKLGQNQAGERKSDLISVSTALQIAGRAGRYGTEFSEGRVTTFKKEDLAILKEMMLQRPPPIEQAGMQPTADQLEMFAYHLPLATLANLIDIFVTLCQIEKDNYFMCHMEEVKFLSEMIQHVELPLRSRYVFCCAPINKQFQFVCALFLKFARMYSQNEPITHDWLCRNIGWPLPKPRKIQDLIHLEQVFDVLDLYLWLSYRFPDIFPDQEPVRDMQRGLDSIIQSGVVQIVKLLKEAVDPKTGECKIYFNGFSKISNSVTDSNQVASDCDQEYSPQKPGSISKTFNEFQTKASRHRRVDKNSLTSQLISSGLLTHKMIEKLQAEWKLQQEDSKGLKKAKKKIKGFPNDHEK